jgi:outer membrane murein-binding lipoprotein Lpp
MILMIPLILTTTPPEGFSAFLASAFYAVGLITALLVLWRQLFPPSLPQPLITAEEKQFVTRDECTVSHNHISSRVMTLESRMDRVERKMEADKIEIIHATQELSDNLNTRINTLLEAISEVRGEIKHLTIPRQK